jgi:hypothetical protein
MDMNQTIMEKNGTISARTIADVAGCAGSVACATHCLIVPISLVFGPIGPISMIEDEVFHSVLLWVLIPAAFVAFRIGCLDHKDKWVLILGLAGVFSLTSAFTFLHEPLGETGERWVATVASALLIAAHVRNFRLCRASACCHEASHSQR